MGLGFNYVTMIGWWGVVAPIFMPLAPTIQYKIGLVCAHIIPLIVQIINIVLSDVRISNWDVWMFWILGSFYIFLNWVFSEAEGEPIYPFMSWEDWKTPFYAELFVGMGTLCYFLTGWVVDKLRDSPYPRNVVYENGQYFIKLENTSSDFQNVNSSTVEDANSNQAAEDQA